jgi:hypothetical protein
LKIGNEFLRWSIITVGGTVSLFFVWMLQNDLKTQQVELRSHQAAIDHQAQINESLRLENSKQIGDALLKLCVEEYRIDQKLARLGIDLLQAPALNNEVKAALADFTSEVSENEGSLQCANPIKPPPHR